MATSRSRRVGCLAMAAGALSHSAASGAVVSSGVPSSSWLSVLRLVERGKGWVVHFFVPFCLRTGERNLCGVEELYPSRPSEYFEGYALRDAGAIDARMDGGGVHFGHGQLVGNRRHAERLRCRQAFLLRDGEGVGPFVLAEREGFVGAAGAVAGRCCIWRWRRCGAGILARGHRYSCCLGVLSPDDEGFFDGFEVCPVEGL